MRMRNERGFNLINLLVAAGVTFAAITAVKIYLSYREHAATTQAVQAAAKRIHERFEGLMKLDSSWRASLAAAENSDMACINNHTSCAQKGGFYALRDGFNRSAYDAHVPANGISVDGTNCGTFSDAGNDGCPFRLDLTWRAACANDCVDPRTIVLTAHLKFRPGTGGAFEGVKIPDEEFSVVRAAKMAEPRNCTDVLQAGRTQDGVYLVHPDSSSPPFAVYCDQTHDGGGWALAISAPTSSYSSFPESTALTPGFTGRLPPAKVKAYLDASPYQASNNLRLELPDVDTGLVLAASTNGGVDPEAYSAKTTAGDCTKVPEARNEATHKTASGFTLAFTGAGELGVDDTAQNTEGFRGFYACLGTTAAGRACGTGCGRKWRGETVRQKGFLWIR